MHNCFTTCLYNSYTTPLSPPWSTSPSPTSKKNYKYWVLQTQCAAGNYYKNWPTTTLDQGWWSQPWYSRYSTCLYHFSSFPTNPLLHPVSGPQMYNLPHPHPTPSPLNRYSWHRASWKSAPVLPPTEFNHNQDVVMLVCWYVAKSTVLSFNGVSGLHGSIVNGYKNLQHSFIGLVQGLINGTEHSNGFNNKGYECN